jgi:hypothetical protein
LEVAGRDSFSKNGDALGNEKTTSNHPMLNSESNIPRDLKLNYYFINTYIIVLCVNFVILIKQAVNLQKSFFPMILDEGNKEFVHAKEKNRYSRTKRRH